MLFFLFPHKVDQSGLELYLIKPLKAFLATFDFRRLRPLGQGKFGQNKTNETQNSLCLMAAKKTVTCLFAVFRLSFTDQDSKRTSKFISAHNLMSQQRKSIRQIVVLFNPKINQLIDEILRSVAGKKNHPIKDVVCSQCQTRPFVLAVKFYAFGPDPKFPQMLKRHCLISNVFNANRPRNARSNGMI